ncbi:MAG: cytochrome c [Candidatus Binatia bacterium]
MRTVRMGTVRRRLRHVCIAVCIAAPMAAGAGDVSHHDLPAGPIRDRHELMEDIGKQAKAINDALKAGATGENAKQIQAAATAIAADAPKIAPLFPSGSTHPKSRALPAIWSDWGAFDQSAKELETSATALATAAGSGDAAAIKAKSREMFTTCKTCHDHCRQPDED